MSNQFEQMLTVRMPPYFHTDRSIRKVTERSIAPPPHKEPWPYKTQEQKDAEPPEPPTPIVWEETYHHETVAQFDDAGDVMAAREAILALRNSLRDLFPDHGPRRDASMNEIEDLLLTLGERYHASARACFR